MVIYSIFVNLINKTLPDVNMSHNVVLAFDHPKATAVLGHITNGSSNVPRLQRTKGNSLSGICSTKKMDIKLHFVEGDCIDTKK